MSRATVAGSPSSESAAPDGLPPARQSRPTLIDATRQSMLLPTLHPATMMLALTAASSHPDCRAVLTQIVALQKVIFHATCERIDRPLSLSCEQSASARRLEGLRFQRRSARR